MKLRSLPFLLAVFCVPALAGADDLDKLAGQIRPKPAEELWRTIPWCRTPEEAAKAATKENRPLFVWVTAGEPFERC